MRKIFFTLFVLAFALPANALLQIAGNMEFNATRGGGAVFMHGIISNEQKPITVLFSADGSASKFLSFPESVVINPGEVNYFEIKAAIPVEYTGKGLELGWFYTTQEGSSGGAAQLNVRLAKKIVVFISDAMDNETDYEKMVSEFTFGKTRVQATPTPVASVSSSTNGGGLMIGEKKDVDWKVVAAVVIAGIIALALFFFARARKRGGEKKK